MCRSEAGNYDRVVIQDLLKEIAQTQQVDLSAKHRFKGVLLHCRTTVDKNLHISICQLSLSMKPTRYQGMLKRRCGELWKSTCRTCE